MTTSSALGAVAPSPLARRNPTVKLAILFIVSLALLFVFDPVTPGLLYLLGLAAVLGFARIPLRTLTLAHLPFVGFALGILVVNALSRPGEVLLDLPPIRVTVEGLVVGSALALRTMAIGILSIGFIGTTDPVALMTSLHQHARLSARVTFAVLAGYRMLQQLPREWQVIRQAQSVRAPVRENGAARFGIHEFGRAAFTLLVVSLRRGERMSQSLESRGLGLGARTVWRPVPLGAADWLLLAGTLGALALAIAGVGTLGLGLGPGVLF
ncbi:energy-coupling factor transporter transmembrane protein EcfT [Cryobacterium sp. PAMC25264]|uniref:energy-coupling factor transporter transmembrane component T family protein n=1 Tax=Cryobacterium sp. PAMC25264 TaxID=2861288 RepID=UPI001C62F64F|nr:energy-coupling factor transporter transmembrane component T [Cryobacterium sp. PAMC25264]QYF72899.1 energy-coupling factor transporter transmembrane protein EcfT [Cryobacterium sp. PAMC25264]